MSKLFELNYAHDLAREQKKLLSFVADDDGLEEILFKHHQMLKRVDFNFHQFKQGLLEEIRSEEEFEHDLISSA